MAVKKRLHKSKDNKVLSGVLGGIGEYFKIDATILRFGWLVIVIFTGFFPGVVAYIIAALIVPQKPK